MKTKHHTILPALRHVKPLLIVATSHPTIFHSAYFIAIGKKSRDHGDTTPCAQ